MHAVNKLFGLDHKLPPPDVSSFDLQTPRFLEVELRFLVMYRSCKVSVTASLLERDNYLMRSVVKKFDCMGYLIFIGPLAVS